MRAGQEQLASEMEQHLSDEEKELILARLGGNAEPEPEMGVASDAYEVLVRSGQPEQDGAVAFAEAQARAALAEKRRAAGVTLPPVEEPRSLRTREPTPPPPVLEDDAEDEWAGERDSGQKQPAGETAEETGTERVATDEELAIDRIHSDDHEGVEESATPRSSRSRSAGRGRCRA